MSLSYTIIPLAPVKASLCAVVSDLSFNQAVVVPVNDTSFDTSASNVCVVPALKVLLSVLSTI